MKRKAQITVFVLLGLMIILAVAGSVYLFSGEQPNPDGDESYSEDISPIRNQIRRCAVTLTENRVANLLEQGGLTDDELEQRISSASINAHELEAVDMYGDGALTVPYWYHSTDSPDCGQCSTKTEIPSLNGDDSVQSKTESYVEANIDSCINNFEDFDGFTVDAGTPDATVRFNANDTGVSMQWPMTVSSDTSDQTFDINTVTGSSDLAVKPLYEAARAATVRMATENLPATYIQKLITYNSFDNAIPPVEGGVKVGKSNDVWFLQDVKDTIRQDLSSYAGLLSIIGPNDPQPSFTEGEVASFAGDLTVSSAEDSLNRYDIEATHRPSWPMTLRINGDRSPLILPETTSIGISFLSFAFTDNDFKYDVSYPLVFEVNDPASDLTVRFGAEGNIRDTKPYDRVVVEPASTDEESSGGSGSVFAGLGNNEVNVNLDGPTTDSGALELQCAGETIPLADTNESTDTIEALAPTCTSGQLTYKATLIQSDTANVSITPNGPQTFTLNTSELQNITVNVERRPVFDQNDPHPNLTYTPTSITQTSPTVGLEDAVEQELGSSGDISNPVFTPATTTQPILGNESVTVLLRQVNGDHVATFEASTDNPTGNVQLYPGAYKTRVIANYNLSEPINTTSEEICVDPPGPFNKECETIPGQQIPQGQRQAVSTCVRQNTDDEGFDAYITALQNAPESATPLSVAQGQGYQIQSCVQNEVDNMDLNVLSGYYASPNQTAMQLEETTSDITIPYYGYHPRQIEKTRDMMIVSALLDLPEKMKDVDELQPRLQ